MDFQESAAIFGTEGNPECSEGIPDEACEFSAEVSVLFSVFEALFDFHGWSDLLHTQQPGRPAPVRPYQADKNLCLLPRNPGPGGGGGHRRFLSGLIYSLPSSREDKPRPARWASPRGLSAAPKRLQPPACLHLRLHHSYQAHSTTDRADTSKAHRKIGDIWGTSNGKFKVSNAIRGNDFKLLVFNKLHQTNF